MLEAYTPSGKVNPHHPILKGKFFALAIDATAKNSQASPKLQRIRDTMNPKAYKTGPVMGWRIPVWGKTRDDISPSFNILDFELEQGKRIEGKIVLYIPISTLS